MTHTQDRAAIGRKISDWTRALGNKDADAVSQFFTKDWKVMHVHASVPFHMDGSLKAAVDLKP